MGNWNSLWLLEGRSAERLLAIPGHDVTDFPVDEAGARGSPPGEAIVVHVGLARSGLLRAGEPVTVGRSRSRISDASTPISTKSITSGPLPMMSCAKPAFSAECSYHQCAKQYSA
jgi:hypothetical protein